MTCTETDTPPIRVVCFQPVGGSLEMDTLKRHEMDKTENSAPGVQVMEPYFDSRTSFKVCIAVGTLTNKSHSELQVVR